MQYIELADANYVICALLSSTQETVDHLQDKSKQDWTAQEKNVLEADISLGVRLIL